MTYLEKLKDPRWQKKRLEIFSRDNWTCRSCGKQNISLHIHHLKYLESLDPWEYEDHFLITYCEVCHETEHLIGDQIRESLIEVIRLRPPLLKPMAQACILFEEHPVFIEEFRKFINNSTILYLQYQKNQLNAEPNAKRLDRV